jgi:hypothetical protein
MGVVLAGSFGAGIFNQQQNILGYSSNITAQEVVRLTNEERAKEGLPPLKINAKLSAAALSKGQYMFQHQFWSHTAPDGTEPWYFFAQSGYQYRVAGENLARDFQRSDDMMVAWMNSPTHKQNIVGGTYTEIGVAVIDDVLQGRETTLVVQLFGKPLEGVAAIPESAATNELTPVEIPEFSPVQVGRLTSIAFPLDATPIPSVLSQTVQWDTTFFHPLLSPLYIVKSLVLSLVLLLAGVLAYDALVIAHYKHTVRVVGKNLAHCALLLAVAFLVLYFRSGMIL